jgi:hypothetical protein
MLDGLSLDLKVWNKHSLIHDPSFSAYRAISTLYVRVLFVMCTYSQFYFHRNYIYTVGSLLLWGGISNERTGLYFTVSAGPRQRSPVFISPRNRLVQVYPQALGSLSVASYDSQS